MRKIKEIPIGGVGILNGYKVTAKEYTYKDGCMKCCFSLAAGYLHLCPINKCSRKKRKDSRDVYFEIVEKGGKG